MCGVGRPNQSEQRKRKLRPIVAKAFVDLGYRRATTAELAQRCSVRENVLFRLWPDKKAMFLDAISHVFRVSAERWEQIAADDEHSAAERLLQFESQHHGELGMYRIIFAGLTETDDADIRRALADTFAQFHKFIAQRVAEHRGSTTAHMDAASSAWAIIGMGLASSVMRELHLLTESDRAAFFDRAGGLLLNGDGS